jgi:hypothetical protein
MFTIGSTSTDGGGVATSPLPAPGNGTQCRGIVRDQAKINSRLKCVFFYRYRFLLG